MAFVVGARRETLLAAHRHRLTREDLEDCYSQATLELLKRAKRDSAFSARAHIANALEQRFASRIQDRRRALGGRSPIEAAVATALPLGAWEGGLELTDARADVERLALARHDLALICRLAIRLSPDQRSVLKSQLVGRESREEFCRAHSWSQEKYRKVAQRARARLAGLLAEQGEIEPAAAGRSAVRACPAFLRTSDEKAGTHL